MSDIIDFIPIATTIFSFFFLREIVSHYNENKTSYLLWWSIGVLTFGLGTLAESIHAIFGWYEINLRLWYIVGALLGGFPLAQGSVFLLMRKSFARITATIIVSLIILASIFVLLTPVVLPEGFDYRLTGSVFEWKWVRYFSPFINLYAFIFLVGGALYSARKYYGLNDKQAHFKGNILIAIGALLPGIGGTFTRMGYVEVLFITELIGLVLIYAGYRTIKIKNREVRLVNAIVDN
ncbi:MAG: hypothetical protein HKN00_02800 [Flavobacteriaceae bacterium]|nr:hypothetical protein [Bacteroidia bacterium]NNF74087.1 hypothetical protein [Flavobacteriaceae bacterium]NNK71796.1 hypothetical protein [Flavobacteriaceae bacterium]